MQIVPNVHDEFSSLEIVVVGRADQMGVAPEPSDCIDARSYESSLNGIYPSDDACRSQINAFASLLEGQGVQVLRPTALSGLNQIFSRDIAFVIEDQIILPNVLEDREAEQKAYSHIFDCIPSTHIIMMPSGCYAEGGDVILHNDYVFVGVSDDATFEKYTTARTNYAGFEYLQDEFPAKEFKAFELKKHDTDPHQGSLHLDCAMQPIGGGLLICPHLFEKSDDVKFLFDFFGSENVFECEGEEGYDLLTNVFSISPNCVILPEHTPRLKNWLEARGVEVLTVQYDEIVKMGGLLRCSTMPLKRK